MTPTLGRIVLVTTPGRKINGQEEHAAIITQVWGPEMVNTKILPGSGPVEDITSVPYADPPRIEWPTWRWPPRA